MAEEGSRTYLRTLAGPDRGAQDAPRRGRVFGSGARPAVGSETHSGRLAPLVPVLKTADAGDGHDPCIRGGPWRDRSRDRRVLVEPEMCSVLVMVGQVVLQKDEKVTFTQNDDAVEHVATARADPPFG